MISKNDLDELKRLATNAYDDDKRFVARVITEINNMSNEIARLKHENGQLKEQLAAKI